MHRASLVIAAVAALGFASSARASDYSLNAEAFGGWQHLELSRQAIGGAIGGSEGNALVGGDLLLKLSILGVGVAIDKTVSGSSQPWSGSILGGLLFDVLPSLRLEALAEVGRRGGSFGDIFREAGSTYAGARPGISFRLLPTPIRIGVSALVRWPVHNGDFGRPDYGFIGRVGFELP